MQCAAYVSDGWIATRHGANRRTGGRPGSPSSQSVGVGDRTKECRRQDEHFGWALYGCRGGSYISDKSVVKTRGDILLSGHWWSQSAQLLYRRRQGRHREWPTEREAEKRSDPMRSRDRGRAARTTELRGMVRGARGKCSSAQCAVPAHNVLITRAQRACVQYSSLHMNGLVEGLHTAPLRRVIVRAGHPRPVTIVCWWLIAPRAPVLPYRNPG